MAVTQDQQGGKSRLREIVAVLSSPSALRQASAGIICGLVGASSRLAVTSAFRVFGPRYLGRRLIPFPVISSLLAVVARLIVAIGIGRAQSPDAASRFHRGMAAMLADRLTATNRLVRFLAEKYRRDPDAALLRIDGKRSLNVPIDQIERSDGSGN